MTPADLRMAAETLSGEDRGRLLERADVLADLLARKPGSDVTPGELAEHYTKALHVTPDPNRPSIPFADVKARTDELRERCTLCGTARMNHNKRHRFTTEPRNDAR